MYIIHVLEKHSPSSSMMMEAAGSSKPAAELMVWICKLDLYFCIR